MSGSKITSAADAAARIADGATVAITGAGGGLLEPDAILAAIETRFLATGQPRDLTVVHSLGIGDRNTRGLNHLGHEGLVKRVIGGHWIWSPRMQALAREEKIEAYVLPSGVIAQLLREIGAGRPGLFTRIGLGTFVDPRVDGGRCNASATEPLVELAEIDGETYLRYKPFAVDVGIVRGSFADPDGNLSFEQEPANLDAQAVALAAHNCGGEVLVQVRTAVTPGSLNPRSVRVPGALVDAVVVDPEQRQHYGSFYDPSLSGERRSLPTTAPAPFTVREVIARRAAAELRDGAVINFGFGIPDGVARLIAARGETGRYQQTIEHGTYGGDLLDGDLFGMARNATAMLDSLWQFDFYGGGGLDIGFLGMGELDRHGNVNVSRLGDDVVGPGGFIDIAQSARKMVFTGTFETKGARIAAGDGELRIDSPGTVRKLVPDVGHITFSGDVARRGGQEVVYVTERAVFELRPQGIALIEVAPGIDMQRDIIDRMGFAPMVDSPATMDPRHFTA